METRELPVYELVLARPDGSLGPQLRQATIDCDALMRHLVDLLNPVRGLFPCEAIEGLRAACRSHPLA